MEAYVTRHYRSVPSLRLHAGDGALFLLNLSFGSPCYLPARG